MAPRCNYTFDQKFTSLQRKQRFLLKLRKRIDYLKTDGCERIKRDIIKKKSERYWDDEIYHQRSAKKNRYIPVNWYAKTYKIVILLLCS
jgi:hypothetical protein